MAEMNEYEGMELSDDMLEGVTGGLFVQTPGDMGLYIVKDATGKVVGHSADPKVIERYSTARGYSSEIISPAEYEARYGKPFQG